MKKEIREKSYRKQIAFDLSQQALAQNYPKPAGTTDPRFFKRAYGDISRFMEHNGFEHRQYSVYVSKESLTGFDVRLLVNDLACEMPWLAQCVEQIDVTNIIKEHSLLHALKDATEQHISREVEQTEAAAPEQRELEQPPVPPPTVENIEEEYEV